MSGFIKGVGPRLVERIIRRFGADTLTIIETDPDRLADVDGIVLTASDVGVSREGDTSAQRRKENRAEIHVKLDRATGEREQEVLVLLVEGLNNTQIADRLVVSPSTIKSHVSHILGKLGVASRTEAAALANRAEP